MVEACTGKKEDGTYLAGDRLTQAISQGVQVEVTYPVSDGNVRDWQALEALWHYVLIEKLGIQPANNTYYVMLALPSPVSRDVYEQGAKILFEKFNAPALSMSEVPLLSAYALGVLTAMVIDIGAEDSSAVAVSDCTVVSYGIVITKIGIVHCTWWLAYLLTQDAHVQEVLEQVAPGDTHAAAWNLAQQLVDEHLVYVDAELARSEAEDDEGVLDVAAALVEGRERDVVTEKQRERDAQKSTTSSANTITVTFRGVPVQVGDVRKRFHEPLFRPAVLERVSLATPMPRAVAQALQARRIGGEPMCISIPEAVERRSLRCSRWSGVSRSGRTLSLQALWRLHAD